jgi:hypothetical protein
MQMREINKKIFQKTKSSSGKELIKKIMNE